jgi:hypothetical protein
MKKNDDDRPHCHICEMPIPAETVGMIMAPCKFQEDTMIVNKGGIHAVFCQMCSLVMMTVAPQIINGHIKKAVEMLHGQEKKAEGADPTTN